MNDKLYHYFLKPSSIAQKKYEALRSFFFEKGNAHEVAERFGYKLSAFYSLARDFREFIEEADRQDDMFFVMKKPGRKEKDTEGDITELLVSLRKKYLSVPDIKAIVDARGYRVSERYIHYILKKDVL